MRDTVEAAAVSINVTITQPTASGDLRVHPGESAIPLVSTINYRPGQTRANNAIVPLGALGQHRDPLRSDLGHGAPHHRHERVLPVGRARGIG